MVLGPAHRGPLNQLPPVPEERLDDGAALPFQDALDDREAVVEDVISSALAAETSAPAFGSRAPKTTVRTLAWTSAPTHIRHGSSVTYRSAPTSR